MPIRVVIAVDFESYWDQTLTLRKVPYLVYMRDPRFETFGAAVKVMTPDLVGAPSVWLRPPQLRSFFASLPAGETAMIGQNLIFDATLAQEHFGFRAAFYLDSMAMAQHSIGHLTGRVSLGVIVKALGLGLKEGSILNRTRGRRWAQFDGWEQARMAEYACEDNEQAVDIVRRLLPKQSAQELWAQDWTIQSFVDQPVVLNAAKLRAALQGVLADKQALLTTVGLVSRDDLMSDEAFANLLRGAGVEPDTKPGKKGPIYAFAKTDQFMLDLTEHDDPYVVALAEARLGHKTTLLQTRMERMVALAETNGQHGLALRYHAAHTGRFGGTDHVNWQNQPRGQKGAVSPIRDAIEAPPGYEILVADYGQIEARVLAWIACEIGMLRLFADPTLDIYCEFGGEHIYGMKLDKSTHPVERQVSKAAVLALGFGQGEIGFESHCGRQRPQIILPPGLAKKAVVAYRRATPSTGALWTWCKQAIPFMAHGEVGRHMAWPWGGIVPPCLFVGREAMTLFSPTGEAQERVYGTIRLPSGRTLKYDGVGPSEWDEGGYVWRKKPNYRAKLWHGLLTENIVQATARDIMLHGAQRVQERLGLRAAFTSHDEMMWVIRTAGMSPVQKRDLQARIEAELCTVPPWAQNAPGRPAIPLTVESKWGPTYGQAK